MKRGTISHPKMVELQARLDIPAYAAVGIMESLWHWTALYCPQGDLGRYSDRIIAHAVGWPEGDAEGFVQALVDVRWLDAHDEHRLVVHDWHDHADDFVHMSLARKGLRFATGEIPKLSRLSKAEREAISTTYGIKKSVRTKIAQKAHKKRTANANANAAVLPAFVPRNIQSALAEGDLAHAVGKSAKIIVPEPGDAHRRHREQLPVHTERIVEPVALDVTCAAFACVAEGLPAFVPPGLRVFLGRVVREAVHAPAHLGTPVLPEPPGGGLAREAGGGRAGPVAVCPCGHKLVEAGGRLHEIPAGHPAQRGGPGDLCLELGAGVDALDGRAGRDALGRGARLGHGDPGAAVDAKLFIIPPLR